MLVALACGPSQWGGVGCGEACASVGAASQRNRSRLDVLGLILAYEVVT